MLLYIYMYRLDPFTIHSMYIGMSNYIICTTGSFAMVDQPFKNVVGKRVL